MARRQIQSLQEVRDELAAVDPTLVAVDGAWSVSQVLAHCAQSIEYSLIGFPLAKPAWFQATVGKVVLRKFLKQGFMSHDVNAAIPGAPPPHTGDARAALDRLLAAIDEFEAHAEPFAPHFAYGPVDKARYGRVQAMHIAQHLESFRPVARPAERVAMKGIA
ncbi:MAG TPA: DUF1569 domain-containing protein [Kofleriaceae bacterium]